MNNLFRKLSVVFIATLLTLALTSCTEMLQVGSLAEGCTHKDDDDDGRCDNCNNPHTHTMIEVEAIEVTCEEDGFIACYTCTECKNYYLDEKGEERILYEDAVIPALGHKDSPWIITTPSTCTVNGVKTRTCSRCNRVKAEKLALAEHTMGDFVIFSEPTEDRPGTKYQKCKDCNHTVIEEIPALNED